jgi:hypothetical protein
MREGERSVDLNRIARSWSRDSRIALMVLGVAKYPLAMSASSVAFGPPRPAGARFCVVLFVFAVGSFGAGDARGAGGFLGFFFGAGLGPRRDELAWGEAPTFTGSSSHFSPSDIKR